MALPLIQLGLIAAAFIAGSAVMKQSKDQQKVTQAVGSNVNERILQAENRLDKRLKGFEQDVSEREAVQKLRDLELAAGQKFPTTQETEGGGEEDDEEEGTTEGMSLSESDRLLLEDLTAAQEDEGEDITVENQRQSARELLEYEQYLIDQRERLRRLEDLQLASQGTPIQPSPSNPFQQCWPCPANQICPQVCYPIDGPPPPWYSQGTGTSPTPGPAPAPVSTTPTCPAGYTYDATFNVCINEAEDDVVMPTAPAPAPAPAPTPAPSPTETIPVSQLPPTSQTGGYNLTRCSNVYNGSCGTECSSGNAQLCADCNATCGTGLGSSTGGGSGIVRDESRCQSEFNGSCGSECEGGNASDCNECRIVCGESSSFARRIYFAERRRGRRMAYDASSDNTLMGAFTPPTDNMALRLMYYTRGRY